MYSFNGNKYLIAGIIFLISGCSSTPTHEQAEKMRSAYCQGNKAIKNASYDLVVKFPKPPKGMAIQDAAYGRKNLEVMIDTYIRTSFVFDMLTDYKNEVHGPHHLDQWYKHVTAGNGWEVFEEVVGNWNWILNSESLPEDEQLHQLFEAFDYPPQLQKACGWQSMRTGTCWAVFAGGATTVRRAPQEDGSIKYQIAVNMGEFCKYAIARSDLYTN